MPYLNTLSILMEFEPRAGVHQVSRFGDLTERELTKLAERSDYALDCAMTTIRAMGKRVTETVRGIKVSERPTEVSIEFGSNFGSGQVYTERMSYSGP